MGAERIRVVHLVTRLNIGGVATEVAALCRLAARHACETTLAAGRATREEGDEFQGLDLAAASRVRIAGLGRRLDPVADVRAVRRFGALVRAVRPHVVHTHTSKAGALGRAVARALRVPVVCHTYHGHLFHGYYGRLRTAAVVRVEALLGRWTDAVVALGPRGAADLQRLGIGRRIEVIRPGFDPARLQALAALDRSACRRALHLDGDGAPVLLVLGRLAPVKGVDVLLQALARLELPARRRPRVLIAGDGPRRAALEAAARGSGLGGAVRFLGWRREVAALLRAADLLVLPSRNEGFPHAVAEALAAGVPVAASRVGEIPDLVRDPRCGVLFPPGDPAALAACLEGLLGPPRRLREMAAAAAAPPLATEEDMVARTCRLYRELLGGPARREGRP